MGATLRYVSVKQTRDGKVATERLYFDQLEFLQQIGALPSAQER
jgi:ketosteroid isomerase-like protein